MYHEHLNVTVHSRPNAYGRNAEAFRDEFSDLARYNFEHDGECSRVFECPRVVKKCAGRLGGLSLHAIATEHVYGLRCQPDVAHNGNLFVNEPLDQRRSLAPSL